MVPLNRLLLFALPLSFLAGGCATTSLKVPIRPSPAHNLAAPPPARFRIPVVVILPKLSEVEKHLAEVVKEDFKKAEKSLGKSLGATIWWDPMTWDFNGNSLTAHVHLHAKNLPGGVPNASGAAGSPETLAQEMEKDMKVDLASAVHWTKDFHLEAPDFLEGDTANASATESDGKKAERLVRRGVSHFHESLKKRTSDILAKAKEMWLAFQEPMRMGEDVWLQIQPMLMSAQPPQIVPDPAGARLETTFEFIGQPNVSFGDKPKVQLVDMPPLKDYEKGPEGFHIERNLKISFKEVNKLLVDPKTGILNKTLPGGGDHNLKIDQMDVYGSGGQLVVEAQVEYQPVMNLSSQPAQLTIYLVGTPVYHEDQQVIDFPDMDFDIKTSDFLVQMAEFMMGSGIREELRKKAVVQVGAYLDKLRDEMTKALNRPLGGHAYLKTTITSLKMKEAYITNDGLEGRVAMDGDASVDVDWGDTRAQKN